jgi:cellulose synthase/poly-beta-1,6-N-acetylglucosamine synthase-like glycosyltransferase
MENFKKSAIIVSYKNKGYIEYNTRKLIEMGYEVVLAIDSPDEECLKLVERLSGEASVKKSISKDRRGKWKALNDAIKLCEGDVVLFLDSDTKIIDFEFEDLDYDLVEIRKEINSESVFHRIVNIDYFNMYVTSKIAEKFGYCLSINGSAFLIKKSAIEQLGGFRNRINEDTDLGCRAGIKGLRYAVRGKAVTEPPADIREWLMQRERWSIGGAQVLIENLRRILCKPKLWLPYTFTFYPALIGLILHFLIPNNLVLKLLYFILPFLLILPPKVLSLILLLLFEFQTVSNILSLLMPFVLWSVTMGVLSKISKFKIDLVLLPAYYFIYAPLWLMLGISALARLIHHRLTRRDIVLRDWKV